MQNAKPFRKSSLLPIKTGIHLWKTVKCHCSERHSQGCGCLTDAFIENARNNFSQVLKESQSAEDFRRKLNILSRHSRNEHQWEDGNCDFHDLYLCKCDRLECGGKPYQTRQELKCPLHQLAYTIELEYRSSKAEQYIHPQ